MKIIIPTAEQVIFINQYICEQQGNVFSINGSSALVNIVLHCASNKIRKEQLMDWFDQHKVKINNLL